MGVKHLVNEQFFENWNLQMAYVLGYLCADGNLIDAPYMRGKYVSVTSTDRESVDRIRTWMGSEHVVRVIQSNDDHRKTRYLLRIGNHKIYDDLVGIGLYPNKSLTLPFPKIPDAHLAHFVRGYLDGDGCVYLEMGIGKRGQRILKRLATIFTSGSREFLLGLERALRSRLGLLKKPIYKSRRSFQLRYSTAESMKLCHFVYDGMKSGQYLQRKFNTYQRYLLLKIQHGAVVK